MHRYVFILLLTATSLENIYSQQNKVDSLQNLLPQTKGEARVKVLHALITSLWLNYPDLAKSYAIEAIRYANELSDVRLRSISNRLMGGVFAYESEFDSAKAYCDRGLQLAIESNDSTLISSAFNNVGFVYYSLGNYPEAFEFLLKSYLIKVKIKEDYGMGNTLNNIGLVYMKVGDYENARKIFNQALKLKDGNSRLYALDNIGNTYLLEGKNHKAEKNYLKAIELTRSIDNKLWKALALDGLGQAYHGMQMNEKARDYFAKAILIRKLIRDRKGESEAYYHVSKMFIPDNPDSAFFYLRESQRLASKLKATDRLLENYAQFKTLFQFKNQLDSALFYQTKYDELKEKQFLDNSRRSIEGIKLKVKEEESQQELLNKNVQLVQKTYQTNLFLVVAALLLIPLGVIFWFYSVQKNLGRRLGITNQKIIRQRGEIEIKTTELEKNIDALKRTQSLLVQSKKMASLGVLTAGIAHEINNPVNFITVGITALEKKLNQLDTVILKDDEHATELLPTKNIQGDIKQLLQDIKIGTSRTEEVISSLRTFSRLDEGELKLADINEVIESTLIILSSKFKDKIEIVKSLEQDLPPILCYPGQLNVVLMNLLINAGDAINAEGTITIQTSNVNNHIEIRIMDTGMGIPKEIQEKIFEPFFTTKDVGEGTGLGLSISYGIVRQHKGTITVSSEVGKGSEFIVHIPITLEVNHIPTELN